MSEFTKTWPKDTPEEAEAKRKAPGVRAGDYVTTGEGYIIYDPLPRPITRSVSITSGEDC